mgnify:CR=1 FL=1
MLDVLERAEAAIYSDPAESLRLARRASADPTLLVRAGTLEAVALAQLGELVQSVGLCMRLLREPMDRAERARLLNVSAAARDLLGQTPEAVELLERAIELGVPDLEAKLRINLGVALARTDRHAEALSHLAAALALSVDPGRRARILLDLAISQRAEGDLVGCRASLEGAAELAADEQTPLLVEQEVALLEAAEGDAAAALTRLRALGARELPVTLEAATWAEIAALDPDLDRAIAAGQRVLDASTDSSEWALRACRALVRRLEGAGRHAEALRFQKELTAQQERDSRQRTRTELALQRVQQEVDRLRDQSDALAAANAELAQALRDKDEYVAIASHDLRSPLTTIQLIADVLTDDGHALGPAVGEASARMQAMLGKLVEAHAAESVRGVETTPVAAEDVARSVAAALAATAAAKGAAITVSGQARVLAEQDALTRTLTNLLENAIKFGAGRVKVQLEGARITVSDDGPGFTADDLGRVFSKFARLSARPTGDESSTGLGLFIVKRLVEAMGGSIGVENLPTGGARFTVHLLPPS